MHVYVRLGWYLLAASLLLWPLLVNADYIYFHDTSAYLRYPAQAFRILFGIATEWAPPASTPAGGSPGTVAAVGGPVADDTVAAGRSIYYGAMLYSGDLLGGLWIGILFQLACAALAVHMTLTSLLGPDQRGFPVVIALLAVATPLSFFVCYLMPDVFAGIAILAVTNLFALEAPLRPWKRALWLALLALSLLFHASHLAIALLLTPPAAAVSWIATGRPPWRAVATVGLAVGIGLLGEGLFFQVVQVIYGAPPLRPPFLMARMISDGPGYAYLTENCPGIGLRLCDFLPRLPMGSDEFLWSRDPSTGLYDIADAATRRALAAEQTAFVIGVLKFDPGGQILASLHDFAQQLGQFSLREFAYTDALRRALPESLPPDQRAAFANSSLYRGIFPLGMADAIARAAFAASAGYLLWNAVSAVFRNRRHHAPHRHGEPTASVLLFAVILIGGVVANAAVTGILSTPHDRYQARVIWLIPLLAMIVFLRSGPRKNAVPQ